MNEFLRMSDVPNDELAVKLKVMYMRWLYYSLFNNEY